MLFLRAKPPQKPQTVDQGHPQVEDDGIGAIGFRFPKAAFSRLCRSDLVPFQRQHPGERGGYALIIVHNENRRCLRIGHAD
jgi:hypothetical protein